MSKFCAGDHHVFFVDKVNVGDDFFFFFYAVSTKHSSKGARLISTYLF